MRRLVCDFIRRYWWMLPLVVLFGTLFALGFQGNPDGAVGLFSICFAGIGLILWDRKNGWERIALTLPMKQRQVASALWFEGVLLIPCLTVVGGLLAALLGPLFGADPLMGVRTLSFQFEIVAVWCAFIWTMLSLCPSATGRSSCSAGGIVGLSVAVWVPLLVPHHWWRILYDGSWITVVPVVLAAWSMSYLLAPRMLTPRHSRWSLVRTDAISKPPASNIRFSNGYVAVIECLIVPLVLGIVTGLSVVIWAGAMWMYLGLRLNEQLLARFLSNPGVVAMPFFLFLAHAGGVSAALRVWRSLPVSTHALALVLTLLPVTIWAGFALPFILFLAAVGGGIASFATIPIIVLFAGLSSFLVSTAARSSTLLAYCLALAVFIAFVFSLNLRDSALPGGGFLVSGLVLASFAYLINKDSLGRKGAVYRPRGNLWQPQMGLR